MNQYIIEKEESERFDGLKVLMCIFVLMIHAFADSVGAQITERTKVLYQGTFVLLLHMISHLDS